MKVTKDDWVEPMKNKSFFWQALSFVWFYEGTLSLTLSYVIAVQFIEMYSSANNSCLYKSKLRLLECTWLVTYRYWSILPFFTSIYNFIEHSLLDYTCEDWILLRTGCNILLVSSFISELNFDIFILYLYESHHYHNFLKITIL